MTLLGRWVTHFTAGPANGNGANIRVPAERIDGTVLQPGQQFSFSAAVQPVTEPPYHLGGVLRNGRIVEDGVLGGGMCSASTTLFNAAMRAGLRIAERHPHAIYISRYPVGLDATVYSNGDRGGQDVVIVNDMPNPILIRGYGRRSKVIFEIWGVNDGRTINLSAPAIEGRTEARMYMEYSDKFAPGVQHRLYDPYDAFSSVVSRTVRGARGNVIHFDTFRSRYRMLHGIIEVGRYPGD
ncbi:MAG: VanW family protein, partial [Chloroflexota bacterium]